MLIVRITNRIIADSVPAIPRPVVRRIAGRYMAGEKLDEAVATIRELNREGCVATADVLGESTESECDAAEAGSLQAGLGRAR
jgi:proline dehydrogenase